MMEQDESKKIDAAELPDPITPEAVEKMEHVVSEALAKHGYEVEVKSAPTGEAADLIIRDADGRTISVLAFKITPDERIAEIRGTLEEIRERNQTTQARLDRVRKRLAIA